MKALIIDDDADILEAVSLCFEIRWPESTVVTATSGANGLRQLAEHHPDVVVLDLGLPDMDGMEVCQHIREQSDAFIIMLTVRDRPQDVIRGLEAGADDYITKPFNQLELLARIRAVLRRKPPPEQPAIQRYTTGDVLIDFATREVKVQGEVVRLTPTEYRLLHLLASNAGKPVTHQELLTKVWGAEYEDSTEYLKTYVQHLRRKLGDDPNNPRLIATERGVGYKFIAPPSAAVP